MTVAIVSGVFGIAAALIGWLLSVGSRTNRLLTRITTQTAVLKDLPESIVGRQELEDDLAYDLLALAEVRAQEPHSKARRRTLLSGTFYGLGTFAGLYGVAAVIWTLGGDLWLYFRILVIVGAILLVLALGTWLAGWYLDRRYEKRMGLDHREQE